MADKGEKPLFGREWLHELQLDTIEINALKYQPSQRVELFKTKYKNTFSPEQGKRKDIKARWHLKYSATPKFIKARPVPYALKSKIDKELGFKPPSIFILTVPRRYICCSSLLLLVLAVPIYTLVQLLC